jgi:hypothetical protein
MATKVFFAPYVRGPELDSDASKPSRQGHWKRLIKTLRLIGRAALGSPVAASAADPTDARSNWAFRVVNYRQAPAVDGSSPPQRRQLPLAVEVSDLELEAISPARLQPGDLIVVEAGQTVFVDGTILAGTAVVDESAITGQSEPLVCSAESRARIMRDSCVVAGQILLRVSARRGHPLDWIETPSAPDVLTQSALRRAAVRS